jgi:hypothetical protein
MTVEAHYEERAADTAERRRDKSRPGHVQRPGLSHFEGEFVAADANAVTFGQRRAGANPLFRDVDSVG